MNINYKTPKKTTAKPKAVSKEPVRIEPSLLSIDEARITEQLAKIKQLNMNTVHFDVMDKKFNKKSEGVNPSIIPKLRAFKLHFTVHLMVKNVKANIKKYAAYNPECIVFQIEAFKGKRSIKRNKVRKMLEYCRNLGVKTGLAFKVSTSLEDYEELVRICNYVTIMAVEPGMGGQKFKHQCIENLKMANLVKETHNKNLIIQLDGGVNRDIMDVYHWYVNSFVSGSYIFKVIDTAKLTNPKALFEKIKNEEYK